MTTPDGEPMLPENDAMHEIESRERLLAWDVPRIAADPEAMKAALKEYLVLLMFEYGEDEWKPDYYRLCWAAEEAALKEYRSSKIVREAAAP